MICAISVGCCLLLCDAVASSFGRVPAPGKRSEQALLASRHPTFLHEFRVGVKRARDASYGDGQGASTHSSVHHWIRLLVGLGLSPFRPVDPISPLALKLCELDVVDLYAWWLVTQQGVNHETAKGYCGTVDMWHERETGVRLAGGMGMGRVYRMLDGYANGVGVPPPRRVRLGVRPRDLRVGIDACFDPSVPSDVNRAACLETATVAVLRGGDGITLGSRKQWDPAWCTTRADIRFQYSAGGAPTGCVIYAINCKARGVESKRKLPRYCRCVAATFLLVISFTISLRWSTGCRSPRVPRLLCSATLPPIACLVSSACAMMCAW